MKNLTLIALAFSALCSTTTFAKAKEGAGSSGGGDICEDRIKVVRDDIKMWIIKDGHKALKLSNSLSHEQYSANMLEQIAKAKVKCVGAGDKDYPVMVSGTAKTCRFDLDQKNSQITCDYKKFQSLNETEQYILVHHEYAGLSSVEIPDGDDSDYSVSNQISKFLENVVTKKLAVKSVSETKALPLVNMPQGSVIEFPIDEVLNAQDSLLRLPTLEFDKFTLVCDLFTAPSLASRKISGAINYTIRSVERSGSDSRVYYIEGNAKLNNKPASLRLKCSYYYNRDFSDLTTKDLQTYLKALNGSLTIAPSVDF